MITCLHYLCFSLYRIAPIGLAALYCHPIEMVISNLVATSLPAYLAGTPLIIFWLWLSLSLIFTQLHHCGYDYHQILSTTTIQSPSSSSFSSPPPSPLSYTDPQPRFHDKHHECFTVNYGVLTWLDVALGTIDIEHMTRIQEVKKRGWVVGNWTGMIMITIEEGMVLVITPFAKAVAKIMGFGGKGDITLRPWGGQKEEKGGKDS